MPLRNIQEIADVFSSEKDANNLLVERFNESKIKLQMDPASTVDYRFSIAQQKQLVEQCNTYYGMQLNGSMLKNGSK
jgi:hypothetical protein